MKKYTLGPDWTPKKLDVQLDVPETLDLSFLEGVGQLPDEELLPEDDAQQQQLQSSHEQQQSFEFNPDHMIKMRDMGFTDEAIKRALWNTRHASSLELAMNWLFEHIQDADINDPFEDPIVGRTTGATSTVVFGSNQSSSSQIAPVLSESALMDLINMGIQDNHARLALKLNVS